MNISCSEGIALCVLIVLAGCASSGAGTPPEDRSSCASLFAGDPTRASGEYQLEDETGLATVYCDMETDGGGWRLIYDEDFEGSEAVVQWTEGSVATDDCVKFFGQFLGDESEFGVESIPSVTLDLKGIAHTEARVELDFLVIDDWDNERGFVLVDGDTVIETQPYVNPGKTNNLCRNKLFGDLGPRFLQVSTDHTASTLTLEIASDLDESAVNESFGIDNVRVLVR
ncbi:MAG: fibrinogen-like YCDxxxxGGGW domain-containing protein [Myxococcota bacterium]